MNARLFLSPPHMGGAERRYVEEVFATNWIAPIGPMVDRLEAELAGLIGMPEVVALSSGTAALHLALRMSGIAPGDEVWSATLTFIGGVAPILYQGGVPLFLDVHETTLLMDVDLLEEMLEQRRAEGGRLPKVVISTDLYGSAVDVRRMLDLRERFGFVWISDTAEAVGSTIQDVHAGCGADFVILSFNGNKIITTSGGGALGCADPARAAEARFLSTQARDPAPYYEHSTYGYNYRMSGICAAIGVGQLEVLSDRVESRRTIHSAYRELLGHIEGLTFHEEPRSGRANRWLTTIELDPHFVKATPEEVRLALERENIESRPLWKPMHLQPVFASAAAIGGERAARAFERGLCLPSGTAMTRADLERVASGVLAALG